MRMIAIENLHKIFSMYPFGMWTCKINGTRPRAKRPWLHLWGVAERSESFKIMIAGGNHTTVKSWQPERAD